VLIVLTGRRPIISILISKRPFVPSLSYFLRPLNLKIQSDIDKKDIRLSHDKFLTFPPLVPPFICRKRPLYKKPNAGYKCNFEIRMIKCFSRMVKKIGTHNGHFHADEVLACVLLVR